MLYQNCVFHVPFRLQYLLLQRRSSVSWLQTWPPWQAGYNPRRFSPSSAQTGFKPHSHILRWRELFVFFERFEEYARPGSHGSRPPWCHCRGWWPSMAQWDADQRTSHGPSGPSASAWCSTAEAIIKKQNKNNNNNKNKVKKLFSIYFGEQQPIF